MKPEALMTETLTALLARRWRPIGTMPIEEVVIIRNGHGKESPGWRREGNPIHAGAEKSYVVVSTHYAGKWGKPRHATEWRRADLGETLPRPPRGSGGAAYSERQRAGRPRSRPRAELSPDERLAAPAPEETPRILRVAERHWVPEAVMRLEEQLLQRAKDARS